MTHGCPVLCCESSRAGFTRNSHLEPDDISPLSAWIKFNQGVSRQQWSRICAAFAQESVESVKSGKLPDTQRREKLESAIAKL